MQTHPTKAQVQVVIDTLTKANEICPPVRRINNLDMMNTNCYGTFLCHGCHYAIGKNKSQHTSYITGAIMLAKELGFETDTSLEEWARDNSDIWGNLKGAYMFGSFSAFASETRPNGARNLQDIIDHWKEVQSRLPE